jgi:hypothetical protein
MLLRKMQPVSDLLRAAFGFDYTAQFERLGVGCFELQGVLHLLERQRVLFLRFKPPGAFEELANVSIS